MTRGDSTKNTEYTGIVLLLQDRDLAIARDLLELVLDWSNHVFCYLQWIINGQFHIQQFNIRVVFFLWLIKTMKKKFLHWTLIKDNYLYILMSLYKPENPLTAHFVSYKRVCDFPQNSSPQRHSIPHRTVPMSAPLSFQESWAGSAFQSLLPRLGHCVDTVPYQKWPVTSVSVCKCLLHN